MGQGKNLRCFPVSLGWLSWALEEPSGFALTHQLNSFSLSEHGWFTLNCSMSNMIYLTSAQIWDIRTYPGHCISHTEKTFFSHTSSQKTSHYGRVSIPSLNGRFMWRFLLVPQRRPFDATSTSLQSHGYIGNPHGKLGPTNDIFSRSFVERRSVKQPLKQRQATSSWTTTATAPCVRRSSCWPLPSCTRWATLWTCWEVPMSWMVRDTSSIASTGRERWAWPRTRS